MNVVCIDFETFFGREYTLKKLTTEEYIRDPRFEVHGAAIKSDASHEAEWLSGSHLAQYLDSIYWQNTAVLCHHVHFDGLILAHHYGVRPKAWLDTLSMARLLLGNHISVSLDSVRKEFGLPQKFTPYKLFEGLHWHELTPDVQRQVAAGACDEVESIWTLFHRLMQQFPAPQLKVVDILARMFVDPVLRGDQEFFGRVWLAEQDRKQNLLAKLGVTEAELQSNGLFAKLLRERGVEPELKDGKNGPIPAFAKTDPFMEALQEDDDPEVRALAEARLGIKSTIQKTRAERLGWMAGRGPLCAYLRPYGARTTRPSGGDKANWLNFKKRDPDLPQADDNASLKGGICAPEGYALAVVDASQIECRILNWLAGQWDVLDRFRAKVDPYVAVAEAFYGYPVDKTMPERQVGKILELQSGYGSGGPKIAATLRTKAGIILDANQALAARDAYRSTHPHVVRLWGDGGRMIARLAGGAPMPWGPCEVRDGRIYLPNGCPLIYDTLTHDDTLDDRGYPVGWKVRQRNGWQKLYGAKLVENVTQALAWNIVSDAMIRVDNSGLRVLNAPYDELLVLVPRDGHEQGALQFVIEEMRRVPAWAEGLPLDAEGHLGERYG